MNFNEFYEDFTRAIANNGNTFLQSLRLNPNILKRGKKKRNPWQLKTKPHQNQRR